VITDKYNEKWYKKSTQDAYAYEACVAISQLRNMQLHSLKQTNINKYKLRRNRCNVVNIGYEDASLGNEACQQKCPDWFTMLAGQTKEVNERNDSVHSNGLQQPWSTFTITRRCIYIYR